jgi:hypothetical protein
VQGAGNFVHARVRLDVRAPLARFVLVSRGGQREIFSIKYEKMPRFCSACGRGHSHLECGTGEYEETNLKWENFLKLIRRLGSLMELVVLGVVADLAEVAGSREVVLLEKELEEIILL